MARRSAREAVSSGSSINKKLRGGKMGSNCTRLLSCALQVAFVCRRTVFANFFSSVALCKSHKRSDKSGLAPSMPTCVGGHIIAGPGGFQARTRLKELRSAAQ